MSKPVKLPKKAPKALKDFVACTVDTLELDPADTSWVPTPKELGKAGSPSVTIEPGAEPGATRVTASWLGGVASVSLDISVVDGQLTVRANGALGEALQGEIDEWARSLNDAVREAGKQFESVTIVGGKARITKARIAVPPPAQQGVVPTPTPAPAPPPPRTTPTPPTPPPTPQPAPATEEKSGCLSSLGLLFIGVIGAGAIGFGLWQIIGDDGGDNETAATTTIAAEVNTPPVDDATTTTAPVVAIPACDAVSTDGSSVGQVPPRAAGSPVWDDGTLFAACAGGPGTDHAAFLFPGPFEAPAVFAPGGNPGVSHNGSVPDAVTGQQGLSQTDPFFFTSLTSSSFRLIADCNGNQSTADATPDPSGIVIFNLPLYSFGQCSATSLVATSPDDTTFALPTTLVGIGGQWQITSAERDPAAGIQALLDSLGTARLAVDAYWDEAVSRLIAADALVSGRDDLFGSGCVSVAPVVLPPPPGCPFTGAPLTIHTVSSGATAFGAPLQLHSGLISGGLDVDLHDLLFGDSGIMRCGPTPVGFQGCADGKPDFFDSFAAISLVTGDPGTPFGGLSGAGSIELANGTRFEIGIGADAVDVTASQNGAAIDSNAVAVVRGPLVTLIVPGGELGADPSYRLSPDGPFTAIDTTVAPFGAPSPPEPESIDTFLAALSASLSSGDTAFALDRLHPQVLDFFPTECPDHLVGIVDPTFNLEAIEVGAVGPFEYQVRDGRTASVPGATTVRTSRTDNGQVREIEAHFVLGDDGVWRWLTDCTPTDPVTG